MSLLRDVLPPAGIVRLLAVSNLAKTTAHGVLMTINVLYFTRVLHIAPERVGLALTLGAAVGMLAGVPAGRLADVRGPRAVTVALMVLLGVAACGYAVVGGFAGLLVATAVVIGAESSANAARGALIAGLLPAAQRARALAYMRSTANIGVALGAVAGGLALLLDMKAGYIGLILAAGALFAVSGLAFLRVPAVPATVSTSDGPQWTVLRDAPYAAVAVLNTVLVMADAVLLVAMPIWISERTDVPPSFFTVMLLVNTTAVVLGQTRLSRGTEDVPGGVRAWRRGGVALAAACAVFAVSAGRPAWLAAVILLAGTLVHVLGEMLQSAGAWSLSFGLAPDHAQGQYQGLFEMSTQLGMTLAPLAITAALAGLGALGLVLYAGLFLLAGVAARPIVQRAYGPLPARPAAAPSQS
jgi:predicted MFS family arabinose efflux permease